ALSRLNTATPRMEATPQRRGCHAGIVRGRYGRQQRAGPGRGSAAGSLPREHRFRAGPVPVAPRGSPRRRHRLRRVRRAGPGRRGSRTDRARTRLRAPLRRRTRSCVRMGAAGMSRDAPRVYADPVAIARLEKVAVQLPQDARVEVELDDGSRLRGMVSMTPTVQSFFDPD